MNAPAGILRRFLLIGWCWFLSWPVMVAGQDEPSGIGAGQQKASEARSTNSSDESSDLPPEFWPLEIVRPTLPTDVAQEVAELEAKIAELEKTGLTAETREAQDAALDEAIALAERVLAIREARQGNTDDFVRWQDEAGKPGEWYEIVDARIRLRYLKLVRECGQSDRKELCQIDNQLVARFQLLVEQRRFAEADQQLQHLVQLHRRRTATGRGRCDVSTTFFRRQSGIGLESKWTGARTL